MFKVIWFNKNIKHSMTFDTWNKAFNFYNETCKSCADYIQLNADSNVNRIFSEGCECLL
ncbi:MAG: hypothetical protein ACFFG0_15595 [Candidatus Thorarchaeota archaeon]